jgi:hypothetical protein
MITVKSKRKIFKRLSSQSENKKNNKGIKVKKNSNTLSYLN